MHASLDDISPQDRNEEFQSEAALARKLGYKATYSDCVPIFYLPGYVIQEQAKFHPIRYLHGIASVLQRSGSMVCEDTREQHGDTSPNSTIAAAN